MTNSVPTAIEPSATPSLLNWWVVAFYRSHVELNRIVAAQGDHLILRGDASDDDGGVLMSLAEILEANRQVRYASRSKDLPFYKFYADAEAAAAAAAEVSKAPEAKA